jgi:REP element-mobilizing transposase RayT
MSEIVRKHHNESVIIYHIVCSAKYRRAVITKETDEKLKEVRKSMKARYEIKFLEIRTERDHACFPTRSDPMYSPAWITQKIKSITAKKIFESCSEVKKSLWGGGFWTKGCHAGTAGERGDEKAIRRYVKNQGRNPKELGLCSFSGGVVLLRSGGQPCHSPTLRSQRLASKSPTAI